MNKDYIIKNRRYQVLKNIVMNFFDKYILLEANSVSDEDYKKMTGSSLEDFRVRMRQHIAETKARVEAAKSK